MSAARYVLSLFAVALATQLVLVDGAAQGQEVPRWKFAEGEHLRYVVTQETEIDVNAGRAGETASFASQILDVVWHVDKVDEAGTMTGVQRVERIRLEIRQPSGKEIVYDSNTGKPAEALSAMLSPLYDVLLSTEVPITVTAAGEVTSCEVPETMTKRIANMPATKTMRDYAAATGVRTLAEQIALPLPASKEEPAKRSLATTLNVLGEMKSELAWTLGDAEGATANLTPTLTTTLEASPLQDEPVGFAQPQPLKSIALESQEFTGEAQFNTEAGRLESLQLDLQMTLKGELYGNQVQDKMHQVIKVERKQ